MATFRKLLVPLDGSRLAEAVLPAAKLLAERFGATVSLLHVMERGAPETVHGEPHLSSVEDAEAYLERVAEQCSCRGVKVECHVHPNEEHDVVASIIQHAGEFDADLILLSAHGWGGMRDILMGSIAQQVLRRGTRPVLLVRPMATGEAPPSEAQRLLVPLDRTEEHDRAVLPVVAEVAKGLGSRVHLLAVVPTLRTISNDRAAVAILTPTATREALRMEEEEARTYLERAADRLRKEKISVSIEVRRGETANCVVEAAEGAQSDLIVMATHGRAGWGAFWSGSVGSKILARIQRPMLLIRVQD